MESTGWLSCLPGVYSGTGDLNSHPAARALCTELPPLLLNAFPMEKYAGRTEEASRAKGICIDPGKIQTEGVGSTMESGRRSMR